MRHIRATCWLLAVGLSGAFACGSPDGLDGGAFDAIPHDAGLEHDGGEVDARASNDGGRDARPHDAGSEHDAGAHDASSERDGGGDPGLDAGPLDAGIDPGPPDAGVDAGPPAGMDAGPPDAGMDADPPDAGMDAGPPDAGVDAGPPDGGCISGSGTHVARFRWEGSGPGSTAYVVYEANTLPDRSRWRAGAYSRSGVGYRPVFSDTFLGEGGLEMGGTTFIDIELSTALLGHVSNATIAIYGRSFATSSSGSFTWMSFDGAGASPYGGVANSAPYQWYPADATTALPAGNNGVLLRIEAGGPSNSLVVRRIEICFDAS